MAIQCTAEVYNQLSPAERSVIEFINENEQAVQQMSITEIAERSFSSPATVSRAIRKCGFTGISALRYAITEKGMGNRSAAIVNDILEKAYQECTETIEGIDIIKVIKAVNYIQAARKIFVVGLGTTSFVAKELEFQLQILGHWAYAIEDSELLKKLDKLMEREDLLIIFSARNTMPELTVGAANAKRKKASVVVCSCVSGTSLEQYADVSIIGCENLSVFNTEFDCVSRVPLHIITRAFIEYLIHYSSPEN